MKMKKKLLLIEVVKNIVLSWFIIMAVIIIDTIFLKNQPLYVYIIEFFLLIIINTSFNFWLDYKVIKQIK